VPPDLGRTTQAAAAGAVAVRRWDDAAKDPAADVPGFARYRPLLDGLLLAG
jgi:gamma-butyrobetaine dioxygenase